LKEKCECAATSSGYITHGMIYNDTVMGKTAVGAYSMIQCMIQCTRKFRLNNHVNAAHSVTCVLDLGNERKATINGWLDIPTKFIKKTILTIWG